MRKVLLIGGEGYIGKVVQKYLLSKGCNVISYDNFSYQDIKENDLTIDKNFSFIKGSINELDKLNKIFYSVDSIVLLAGLVGDPITKKYPIQSNLVNNIYIKKIIKNISLYKIKKFIFISTCSNYGLLDDNEFADENFILKPLSLYAKSKVEIENYILSLKNLENFNPTILRFATAFGISDRMRFDLTLNEFVAEIFFGNTLKVFDKDTWRPYCHVMDFSRLIEIVLFSENNKTNFEVFNAGGEQNNATKQSIINSISKFIPNPKVEYVNHGNDKRNYRVNFNKVKNILDFTPRYSIDHGVKEIIEALRNKNYKDYNNNKNYYGNYQLLNN